MACCGPPGICSPPLLSRVVNFHCHLGMVRGAESCGDRWTVTEPTAVGSNRGDRQELRFEARPEAREPRLGPEVETCPWNSMAQGCTSNHQRVGGTAEFALRHHWTSPNVGDILGRAFGSERDRLLRTRKPERCLTVAFQLEVLPSFADSADMSLRAADSIRAAAMFRTGLR